MDATFPSREGMGHESVPLENKGVLIMGTGFLVSSMENKTSTQLCPSPLQLTKLSGKQWSHTCLLHHPLSLYIITFSTASMGCIFSAFRLFIVKGVLLVAYLLFSAIHKTEQNSMQQPKNIIFVFLIYYEDKFNHKTVRGQHSLCHLYCLSAGI